jgi:hypothetical protein
VGWFDVERQAVNLQVWVRPMPNSATSTAAGSATRLIPVWPYSLVAALETGRTSWTALLDAVRLDPADDATAVTAAQLRAVMAAAGLTDDAV